jgi:hypothetical protein
MFGVELNFQVYLNEVSALWGCIDCTAYRNNYTYCYIQLFYGQTDYEAHLQPVCGGGGGVGIFRGVP